jgi:hypothetical protein
MIKINKMAGLLINSGKASKKGLKLKKSISYNLRIPGTKPTAKKGIDIIKSIKKASARKILGKTLAVTAI